MSIFAVALECLKCLNNKEKSVVEEEAKPALQTSSPLGPGQKRMSEFFQSSKHRGSILLKMSKYVIPKSVKKKIAFSALTKKCETK